MSQDQDGTGGDERWATFRFGVVGPLLAAPPAAGELKAELKRLANKAWRHPITQEWVHFGVSTIERWYYRALQASPDPVGALARKVREDHGTHPSLSAPLCAALRAQYQQHPGWSYRLQADNLGALIEQDPKLGPSPSYESVRRFLQAHGLWKRPRRGRGQTAGVQAAEQRFETLEIRSYESEYVHALWHLDFHGGSLKVLDADGQWVQPQLLAILDDHSRLCCHLQWYWAETAQNLVHGLCQAFEKRALPRALMTDNGSAMIAAETVQGLARLGIVHEKTLPYSPYQNGKQESFWGQVEGRLLAMLEGCRDLTLAHLNEASLAWVEGEYHRKLHSELDQPPLTRYVQARDVGRPCPASQPLRLAFTAALTRTQRRSDGTFTLGSVRFEVPSPYRHLKTLAIRYASWDLSQVYLAEPRSGQALCRLYPQDKRQNADGQRRRKEPLSPPEPSAPTDGMAPLLRNLIARYAATGLPPAYLPKDETIESPPSESPHE